MNDDWSFGHGATLTSDMMHDACEHSNEYGFKVQQFFRGQYQTCFCY